MRLFDPHAHLAGERFAEDLPDIIARMQQANVVNTMIICDPGDEEPDHLRALEIVNANPNFYLSIGVHPHNAKGYTPAVEQIIRDYVKKDRCVCLGEIGLDYYYDFSPRETQRAVLERQLDLALELNLPVQFHIRDAHGEAMDMLRARYKNGRLPRGVMHCFSGSWEVAKVYLDMGLYISLSGVVTFKNANKLPEVAKNIPEDRILVETDCPYMAPVPMRGKRNEPAFVRYTFERVAELRGADPESFSERVYANTRSAFGL